MGPIATQLVENERRLTAAWGPPVPRGVVATPNAAERALESMREAVASRQHGRDSWLTLLAAGYEATHDERYADAARALWVIWLDNEPLQNSRWLPKGRLDPLMIPHRLGDTECDGWFGALPVFCTSNRFDEAFIARIVDHARAQLDYLCDHLYVARNMRMTQGDGLLTQGLRLAFLPEATRWRETGRRIVAESLAHQFNADGGSIEATGWYHFICMNMALRFHRLGKAMPELGLHIDPQVLAKGFDYLSALVQPDGNLAIIGDCTSPLPYHGSPLKQQEQPQRGTLAQVNERRASVLRELGMNADLPPTSQIFPHTAQAMLRSDWSDAATYLTFDATRRSGYHWHPARNAIQIFHHGKRMLSDPGRMSYDATPERTYAVSTRGHSTINFNGWNQSDAPSDISLRCEAGFDLVTGYYAGGYWPGMGAGIGPGIYGTHHRTMLWVRGRFVIVLDHVAHQAMPGHKPTIECNWQFGIGSARFDADTNRVITNHDGVHLLALPALYPDGTTFSLHSGDVNPHRGWCADDKDQPQPAPMLHMRVEQYDPWNADFATVFVPFVGTQPELDVARVARPEQTGAGHVTLRWCNGETDEVWWTRQLTSAIGRHDGIDTNAAFVHARLDASGRAIRTLVVDGTMASPYTRETRATPSMFVAE